MYLLVGAYFRCAIVPHMNILAIQAAIKRASEKHNKAFTLQELTMMLDGLESILFEFKQHGVSEDNLAFRELYERILKLTGPRVERSGVWYWPGDPRLLDVT